MKSKKDALQSELESIEVKNSIIQQRIEEITSDANYYFGIWSLDSASGRLSLNPGFILCVIAICILLCLIIYLCFSKYHERTLAKQIYDLNEKLKYL